MTAEFLALSERDPIDPVAHPTIAWGVVRHTTFTAHRGVAALRIRAP